MSSGPQRHSEAADWSGGTRRQSRRRAHLGARAAVDNVGAVGEARAGDEAAAAKHKAGGPAQVERRVDAVASALGERNDEGLGPMVEVRCVCVTRLLSMGCVTPEA